MSSAVTHIPSTSTAPSKTGSILTVLMLLVLSAGIVYMLTRIKKQDKGLERLRRENQQQISDGDVVQILQHYISNPASRPFLRQHLIPLMASAHREDVPRFTVIQSIPSIHPVSNHSPMTVELLNSYTHATEPEVSSEPETAHMPEVSSEPETVHMPEVSSEPETAHMPEVSSEPETVHMPEVSSESETVHMPEVSSEPETVHMPEVSSEPETAHMPEVLIEPETVHNPKISSEAPLKSKRSRKK